MDKAYDPGSELRESQSEGAELRSEIARLHRDFEQIRLALDAFESDTATPSGIGQVAGRAVRALQEIRGIVG
jgi:hypothetical protein